MDTILKTNNQADKNFLSFHYQFQEEFCLAIYIQYSHPQHEQPHLAIHKGPGSKLSMKSKIYIKIKKIKNKNKKETHITRDHYNRETNCGLSVDLNYPINHPFILKDEMVFIL